jgi:YD repeat-containing protein
MWGFEKSKGLVVLKPNVTPFVVKQVYWAALGLILCLSACSKKSENPTDSCTPRLLRSSGTQSITTYQYDAKGRYKGFSSSATDGPQVEFVYDSLSGRLLGIGSINLVRANSPGNNYPMEALSIFEYTADGKIGRVLSADFTGNVWAELTPRYEGTRLVAIERSGYQSGLVNFTYDARGNLTGSTFNTESHGYRYTEYDDKPNPFNRNDVAYALYLSTQSLNPNSASSLSRNNALKYTQTTSLGTIETARTLTYNAKGWPVLGTTTTTTIRNGTTTTATSTVKYDYECL